MTTFTQYIYIITYILNSCNIYKLLFYIITLKYLTLLAYYK